jgi:hypothetical protein
LSVWTVACASSVAVVVAVVVVGVIVVAAASIGFSERGILSRAAALLVATLLELMMKSVSFCHERAE